MALETVKKDISAVLIPSKDGVPSKIFMKEYSDLIGSTIIPSTYGFRSLHDLMRGIPDVVKIIQAGPGNYVYKAVGTSETAHITQMVSRQKRKKKKGKGGTGRGIGGGGMPSGPRLHNWGGNRKGSGDAGGFRQMNWNAGRQNQNSNRNSSWQNRNRANQGLKEPSQPIPDLMSCQPVRRIPAKDRLGHLQVTVNNSQIQRAERQVTNDRTTMSFVDSIQPNESSVGMHSHAASLNRTPGPHDNVNQLTGLLSALDVKASTSTANGTGSSFSYGHVRPSSSFQQSSARINRNSGASSSNTSLEDVSPVNAPNNGNFRSGAISGAVASQQSSFNSNPGTPLSPRVELPSGERIPRNLVMMNFEQQKPLEIGKSYTSVCCYVKSPDSFFVHLTNDLGTTLIKIRKACERAVNFTPDVSKLQNDNPRTLRKTEYVILQDAFLNEWCRARLDENFNQYLIDYGFLNEEFQTCYRMPRSLYSYPYQAYRCKVAGLQPKSGHWSGEAIETFRSEAEYQKVRFTVKSVSECGDVYEVDLFSEEDENIGDLLCAEGHARRPVTRCEGIPRPVKQELPNMKGIFVRVVCIESPCSVYVNLMSTTSDLDQLVSEMMEYGTQSCDTRSLVKVASVGQYYLCRDEDQEFFRVQVLEVNGAKTFVEYVDFGEKDYLPATSHLFPLKTSFFEVPLQGIHVIPNDFMQCSDDEEVMSFINEYLLHKELFMDVLNAESYDGQVSPIVTFCDKDDEPVTPERIFGSLQQPSPSSSFPEPSDWIENLERRINSASDLLGLTNFVSIPELGKVYIAYNPDVGRFCRAVVLNDDNEKCFTMKFVDYGTTLVVPKYLLDGASFLPEIGMNLDTGI